MASLSVWEMSGSGHKNNQLTFLFIAYVPAERTCYLFCFKVRITPVLLLVQRKDCEKSNASDRCKFKHKGSSLKRNVPEAYS